MSSSPTPRPDAQLVRVAALLPALADLADPRARRGRRHGLLGLVAVSLCAVLTGARSFAAIGQWAGELDPGQLAQFGLERALAPNTSTFRRVFTTLDAAALDALFAAFMWTRTATMSGPSGARRVIAIDGKTVRGARSSNAAVRAPHLVAAFDHATGTVLGQLAVAAKSNEIPAVRTLLGRVRPGRCRGHRRRDAHPDRHRRADHRPPAATTCSPSRPTSRTPVRGSCKALPWAKVPAALRQRGHRPRRRVTPHDQGRRRARVGHLRRRRPGRPDPPHRTPRQREEDRRGRLRHHLRRPTQRRHAVLAAWVQRPLGDREPLHWVRDVTFDEDRSPSAPATPRRSWRPCATRRSACSASTGTRTSPPPSDITPRTPPAPSTCS